MPKFVPIPGMIYVIQFQKDTYFGGVRKDGSALDLVMLKAQITRATKCKNDALRKSEWIARPFEGVWVRRNGLWKPGVDVDIYIFKREIGGDETVREEATVPSKNLFIFCPKGVPPAVPAPAPSTVTREEVTVVEEEDDGLMEPDIPDLSAETVSADVHSALLDRVDKLALALVSREPLIRELLAKVEAQDAKITRLMTAFEALQAKKAAAVK